MDPQLMSEEGLHAGNREALPAWDKAPWQAIYTSHQHEKSVAHHLTLTGFEVYLPLYHSVRRWKDRRKELALPLLPCYVFVRGGRDKRLDILKTPGVRSFVCSGREIAAIGDMELDPLRRIVDSRLPAEACNVLHSGDLVKVCRGPMAGIEGVLLRRKEGLRLIISIQLLHRGVSVEVDEGAVTPIACVEADE